jgi:penicillin-binding protein-related factor A (putative recombinase)
VAYFAFTTDIVKAYEEKIIHFEANQTPEQKFAVEALKEQWLADFNRLLNGI